MKTSAFKKWKMIKVLLKMARFVAEGLTAPFIHRGGARRGGVICAG